MKTIKRYFCLSKTFNFKNSLKTASRFVNNKNDNDNDNDDDNDNDNNLIFGVFLS